MNTTTPPGWYPDPNNPQAQRYWDGSQWTEHTADPTGGQAEAGQPAATQISSPQALQTAQAAPVAAQVGFNPYAPDFDVNALPAETRQSYMRHELTQFSPAGFLALSVITFGIFGFIYHGLKHSKMPLIKQDDFEAGKGIGFMFIPYFNLYWQFPFWLRLTDRLNFQYRLRNQPPPINRGLVLWAIITPLTIIGIVAYPFLAAIAGWQIQKAANALASGEADHRAAGIAPALQSTTA